MEFRPCIDIHNGKVKQIVGSSLRDEGNAAVENFVSEQDAAFYAKFYRKDNIRGGHIILLNARDSEYYSQTKRQALLALQAYPNGFGVGGGITEQNAEEFLSAGASHVIVTSYVFSNGKVNYENLRKLTAAVGKERLILDLSCRKKDGCYYVVTDRWQKFTKERITDTFLDEMGRTLGNWAKIPITYAGGIGSFQDLRMLKEIGRGRLHVTIGSALDLFGGTMPYEDVLDFVKRSKEAE